jgi:single-stranded-DNA-specific exonuclease
MKERHVRLELVQERDDLGSAIPGAAMRAVAWDQAARASELGLRQGSLIDLAYRIRENDHPDFGGLEVEIAGMRLFDRTTQTAQAHD